jgi:hypothetical protein
MRTLFAPFISSDLSTNIYDDDDRGEIIFEQQQKEKQWNCSQIR